MAEIIREYGIREKEYKKLKLVAEFLNDIALERKIGRFYEVKDTYFDYGQNWKWTTIIKEDFKTDRTCQILSPKELKEIITTDSIERLYEIAESLF